MKKNILFFTLLIFGISSLFAQHTIKQKGQPFPVSTQEQPPTKQVKAINNFADGFESYGDFLLAFSPWTLVDVDQSDTYSITDITFPNQNAAMAYMVFNPSATSPAMTNPAILPHTGQKFAACFASIDPPNNDWLISPQVELGTNSQLRFWVKSYISDYGLERYKVGVSTSGTNPSDFTIISGSNYLEAPATAWQEKVFDLNAYNGQTVYVGIQCVSNDAFILMVDDFEITSEAAAGATLTGKVTDAFNGNPIAGATVSVSGLSATTDSNGDYTINNVPPGMLNADFLADNTNGEAPLTVNFTDLSSDGANTVTCEKSGYITYVNNQVNIPENGTLNLNISLSPTLAEGEMRFVLNWSDSPSDLDSHLNTPEIEGSTYHIYYSNQGSATSAPYAALDHDVTSGYGPETMTIYQMFSGTYQYYIYNYSGSPDITTSQAVIQIYNANGLLQTLQVPTSGVGRYWYVCDVNGSNGQISIKNTIQENAPGSTKFDMPAKAPQAKNVSSWSWNFGDGSTSTLQNPSHVYTIAGTYTVSLTVGNGSSTDTETKTSYITVEGGAGGTGTLTGMVTDAFSGNAIEGAVVSVAGLSATTDASGNYSINNIPIGVLNADFFANNTSGEAPLTVSFTDLSSDGSNSVSCSKTGYITYINNNVNIPQGGSLNLNISLSPTLAEGEIRFVLNWSDSPSDLDSHLNTPEIEGTNYHIYYSSQGSATTAPYAALDHDVTTGYGPETMTIYQLFNGTYQYYIYNYSTEPEMTSSQAVVQIYNANGLLQTLPIPTSGTGLYWYVCDVNGSNGQITIKNTIQETAPGSTKFEMPAKTPHPKNVTSWSWNFGDGSTSTLQNPTHVYNAAGTYTVSLTVGNGSTTNTETKTGYITVTGTSGGTGTITGMVSDALTGETIEGALVSVAGLSDLTDASGNYTVENVPIGVLTANFSASTTAGQAPLTVSFIDQSTENSNTVSCSKDSYSTYSNNQVIIPQDGTLTLNISLSPALAEGTMRFVLNWSAIPEDLDSHLGTPEIEGTTYHIYYSSQGSATTAPYAALDHDVTSGYGPETMTIYDFFNGTYKYYIYDFTGGETPISASQAVVQIYNQAGLLHTLQVPTSGTGRYWYVCDINGANGQVTIRNVIMEDSPYTTKDPMPAKANRNNANITSWLWNFGDGATSSAQNPSHTYTVNGTYTVSLTVTDNSGSQHMETKNAYIQVGAQALPELDKTDIRVFPQPATNQLTVVAGVEINKITFCDLGGRVLRIIPVEAKEQLVTLDFVQNGMYLLLIESENGTSVRKILVK